MIPEDNTPLHVHNPRKIKRKHCGIVVYEPEKNEYKDFLKNGGLWIILTSFHMVMIDLF
jgi:hypothetical protein